MLCRARGGDPEFQAALEVAEEVFGSWSASVPPAILSEFTDIRGAPTLKSVIVGRYHYIWGENRRQELYDLVTTGPCGSVCPPGAAVPVGDAARSRPLPRRHHTDGGRALAAFHTVSASSEGGG
jgi:hypothetical protein